MKTTTLSVSSQDAKIIAQVVELFSDGLTTSLSYQKLKTHLLRIFGQDITCDHYIMLGQVIGIKAMADKNKLEKLKQQNYVLNDN